jgi:hypothetical protein
MDEISWLYNRHAREADEDGFITSFWSYLV